MVGMEYDSNTTKSLDCQIQLAYSEEINVKLGTRTIETASLGWNCPFASCYIAPLSPLV